MGDDNKDKVEQKEFQFVQEKIKQPPLYQNKMFRKVIWTAILAVLFGAVACMTFVVLYPKIEERFGEDPAEEINIPRDEEPVEEPNEEPEVVEPQEPVVITEPVELELEDYSKLYSKMREVARAAEKSLVTVTAGSSDMDWFNERYESESQFSGLIVGNNGVEELILTTYSEVAHAEQIHVTFSDSTMVEAALKKYDNVTDLAVLSVNLSDLTEETLGKIQDVTWGNSLVARPTNPVIAIGSPAGIMGSMLFGNLTATDYDAMAVDGEYQLLITDMIKSNHSNGVLIDFEGKVIGWIQNSYSHANNPNALTAYGISDLKGIIEHLCNNQDIVYLGIRGVDVTTTIQQQQELPKGVYVTNVEMDSPAMAAGIQTGDIIVAVSGQPVERMAQFQELMFNFSEGQSINIEVMRQGRDEFTEITCTASLSALK